ncbi:MarR family winged helix-turn-helix transcriptional regulator [Glaciibacter sp. 2TAF33]|uniref:MarR family winged helix-turn-helix transcriptional regulator n=1 Tax=Glaciibacter sp. 2TAF33 TaxID=3233015 RepID=UPI003F8E55F2
MIATDLTSQLTDTQAASWASYQRMRARLGGRLGRELARDAGVSDADYEILWALLEAPGDSVRALALRCGLEWEKSRLSHQLRRMEERGLVIRRDCSVDNRGTDVSITEAGRSLAVQARAYHDEAVRRYVVDALTPEQLLQLEAISEAIVHGLDQPRDTQ